MTRMIYRERREGLRFMLPSHQFLLPAVRGFDVIVSEWHCSRQTALIAPTEALLARSPFPLAKWLRGPGAPGRFFLYPSA